MVRQSIHYFNVFIQKHVLHADYVPGARIQW